MGQAALATMAKLGSLATTNLQLTDSADHNGVRIPLSPPLRINSLRASWANEAGLLQFAIHLLPVCPDFFASVLRRNVGVVIKHSGETTGVSDG